MTQPDFHTQSRLNWENANILSDLDREAHIALSDALKEVLKCHQALTPIVGHLYEIAFDLSLDNKYQAVKNYSPSLSTVEPMLIEYAKQLETAATALVATLRGHREQGAVLCDALTRNHIAQRELRKENDNA